MAERLADELGVRYGRAFSFTADPRPLGGGFSSDLFEFVLDEPPAGWVGHLVLRLLPATGTKRSAVREQTIHAEVAAVAFPTAPLLLYGGADSAFGRPYTIMPKLDGAPAVALDGVAALKAARQAPTLVADTMVRLHELDAQPVVSALRERGITSEHLGVEAIWAEIEQAATDDHALAALSVLRAGAPGPGPSVVVHGDLHALNLWRTPDGSVVLMDWELATVGPPELDVARAALVFSVVPGEISRVGRPVVMRLGRRMERSFIDNYTRQRPLDTGSLAWYRALHALRLVTVVLSRPADDSVAMQWRPVARQLAQLVESATGVAPAVVPRAT